MSRQAGFSLLEATTSMAIVAILLTGVMATLDRAPKVIARTEARQMMIAEAERALEELRAGTIELRDGRVLLPASDPRLSLRLEVERDSLADLYVVTVFSHFELIGGQLEDSLTSKIWRP